MNERLSKNFKRLELACPCCGQMECEPKLIEVVQIIRNEMETPFFVNSGYRCVRYNSLIRGASKKSYHVKGLAIDISTTTWSGSQKHRFVELATNISSGIGVYETFIHFDLRENSSLWLGV